MPAMDYGIRGFERLVLLWSFASGLQNMQGMIPKATAIFLWCVQLKFPFAVFYQVTNQFLVKFPKLFDASKICSRISELLVQRIKAASGV